jgi:hypothetical protein
LIKCEQKGGSKLERKVVAHVISEFKVTRWPKLFSA